METKRSPDTDLTTPVGQGKNQYLPISSFASRGAETEGIGVKVPGVVCLIPSVDTKNFFSNDSAIRIVYCYLG